MTAHWPRWRSSEVSLVINVISCIRQNTRWWAQRTTSRIRVREQKVIRNRASRTSKYRILKIRIKNSQHLCHSGLDSLNCSGNEERSNRVESLVDVAKNGGDVEVWSAELSDGHTDWIFGVDVE